MLEAMLEIARVQALFMVKKQQLNVSHKLFQDPRRCSLQGGIDQGNAVREARVGNELLGKVLDMAVRVE